MCKKGPGDVKPERPSVLWYNECCTTGRRTIKPDTGYRAESEHRLSLPVLVTQQKAGVVLLMLLPRHEKHKFGGGKAGSESLVYYGQCTWTWFSFLWDCLCPGCIASVLYLGLVLSVVSSFHWRSGSTTPIGKEIPLPEAFMSPKWWCYQSS